MSRRRTEREGWREDATFDKEQREKLQEERKIWEECEQDRLETQRREEQEARAKKEREDGWEERISKIKKKWESIPISDTCPKCGHILEYDHGWEDVCYSYVKNWEPNYICNNEDCPGYNDNVYRASDLTNRWFKKRRFNLKKEKIGIE